MIHSRDFTFRVFWLKFELHRIYKLLTVENCGKVPNHFELLFPQLQNFTEKKSKKKKIQFLRGVKDNNVKSHNIWCASNYCFLNYV